MSKAEPTLAELFEDGRAIDEALLEAARDARRFHKAIGNPMATWLDGRVVWVQPEDIRVDDESSARATTATASRRGSPCTRSGRRC
jgi:hypothetical protein